VKTEKHIKPERIKPEPVEEEPEELFFKEEPEEELKSVDEALPEDVVTDHDTSLFLRPGILILVLFFI